jgi:hypothetical protein
LTVLPGRREPLAASLSVALNVTRAPRLAADGAVTARVVVRAATSSVPLALEASKLSSPAKRALTR